MTENEGVRVRVREMKVTLQDMESIQAFTKTVSEFDYGIYLRPEGHSKETKLNAKSFLSVISLIIHQRLELIVHTDDSSELIKRIQPYIVKA